MPVICWRSSLSVRSMKEIYICIFSLSLLPKISEWNFFSLRPSFPTKDAASDFSATKDSSYLDRGVYLTTWLSCKDNYFHKCFDMRAWKWNFPRPFKKLCQTDRPTNQPTKRRTHEGPWESFTYNKSFILLRHI